mmetsp:Transcript_51144/g.169450  ORF Transcript_51144/g.169450 Transcript_51144/m.169450 type:complete len:242 (+) Transcript_51144:29-754(+)
MLQAAARKAAAVQRSSFFSLLRVKDVLVPQATAAEPLSDDAVARVKEDISQSADALIEAHKPLLPENCERAPAHLQMAALALAAQRHLLHVSATTDELNLVDAAEVRWVVGGAIGVVAPPNGEEPWAVPVNYVPNRLSMVITGSVWFPGRRRKMVERMLANWRADLGEAFATAPAEPAPSCRMTKCLYTEFLHEAGDEHAEDLTPLFHALHSATFAGVTGFRASSERDGRGRWMPVFLFDS